MLCTGVYLEFLQLSSAKPVVGHHALDSMHQDALGMLLEHVLHQYGLLPSGVPGMTVVDLLIQLPSGDVDLVDVDDNDKITRVDMRSVNRLVLALQNSGNTGCKATESVIGCVNKPPFPLDLTHLCGISSQIFSFLQNLTDCKSVFAPWFESAEQY